MDVVLSQTDAGLSSFTFATKADVSRMLKAAERNIDDPESRMDFDLLTKNTDQWFQGFERFPEFKKQVEKAAEIAFGLMKKRGYSRKKLDRIRRTKFWVVRGTGATGSASLGLLGDMNVGLNPDSVTGDDATPGWFVKSAGQNPSWLPQWQEWKTVETIVHEWLHHLEGKPSDGYHGPGDPVYTETQEVMKPFPEPGVPK
jgi:hypothetical protein